jgi:hypothetical protein
MLITFKSTASAPVQMFGHIALQLLELMGRQPKSTEQIPASADLQGDNPAAIPLRNRALPLIQLMQAAIREQKGVSWE